MVAGNSLPTDNLGQPPLLPLNVQWPEVAMQREKLTVCYSLESRECLLAVQSFILC